MRFSSAFAFLALLVFATCASAGIIGVNCYNDGDGAINMNDWWHSDLSQVPSEVDVYMDETLKWAPAHALVDITTNTPEDPIARFTKEVDNATASAWSGYTINVIRNGSFSITSAIEPIGWDAPVITAPTLQLSGIYAGQYLGTVSYSTSNPLFDIPINGTGVFKLTTSFAGSSTFTLEQIPVNAVPEPGTLALLACGFVGLLVARRRFAR
jgi:hypothetical protein